MKKAHTALALAFLLALSLCTPAMAAMEYGVIYDETESLGSQELTMQGEQTLPQLSQALGLDLRVDVLTQNSYDGLGDAAAGIYEEYDYGYGEHKEGVTLTILLEPQDGDTYRMVDENDWCVYARLSDERGSGQELSGAVYDAVQPYMAARAWNGEDMTMSGEAACRQEICVPAIQMELARAVAAAGKPVVTGVTCGRPLLLDWFDKNASAVLCAWFAGTEAGHALADLLAGDANPSGKLSVTFPRSMGQIPLYYNHMNTGRPWNGVSDEKFVSRYLDGPNTPLYPFGHGLSYSSFRIKEAALSSGEMAADGALTVRVQVQNDSDVAGTAVLQMYLHDVSARIARPVKELKGFARVDLAPGEEKEVCLPITPDLLRFHDGREWLLEPGRFVVMLGFSSADDQLEKLEFSLI